MIQVTITDQEFRQLATYIHQHFGIHLKEEKKALVVGRLQQKLQARGIRTFSEYYQFIVSDRTGEAATELINSITTNHTFFMREPDHFYFFRDEALPKLRQNIRDHDLRVWCAGCSTGEEAYTLSMLIDEYFKGNKIGWDTSLLATDISTRALEQAMRGQYPSESIVPLPAAWKSNYFKKASNTQHEVVERIKKEIIFRKFNLMERIFPFKKKFHVIFCRNVMIYFDGPTKEAIIKKFYDATEPGGYLFIGHSESLERNQFGYKYVMPSVYQKV